MSRGRLVFFYAAMAAIALISIELLLQAFYLVSVGQPLFRRQVVPIFEADPARCYRLIPNLAYHHRTNEFDAWIYTNAQGFRTGPERRPVRYEKEPGVYRILFLGPSFAFGWGNDYEKSYAALIAKGLEADGRKVEVVNLGTPGQGPSSQLCWLEDEGYRYRPDMIVQTVYDQLGVAGRCIRPDTCPYIRNGHVYTESPTLLRELISYSKHSGIVFYGYYAYNALFPATGSKSQGVGKELYAPEERNPAQDVEHIVRTHEMFVDRIHEITGPETAVAFVFVPLSFVVHTEDVGRWRHLMHADPMARRRAIASQAGALEEAGIALVDPTSRLVEAGAHERMYYWLDIHLTERGNEVVAETALPILRRLADDGPAGEPPRGRDGAGRDRRDPRGPRARAAAPHRWLASLGPEMQAFENREARFQGHPPRLGGRR